MRVEMVEIGVQLRKFTILSIRKCYRLVCNHPFLVGILLFLFFLYRSFPFLFSLLVSTSPVLVCTAFLLGFLLSLGDPNIPEIENEESVNHEIVSLRTEVQRDTTVVERDESFVVERYSGSNNSVDRVDGGLVNSGPLIEDYFTEIKPERGETGGVDRELHDPTDTSERKNDETVFLENQYSRIEEMDEESVGLLYAKSPLGSIDSDVAERGDSPPASPWKQFGEGDDNMAGDDMAYGDSDSSSDRAESSSPDASMADIIPLLDELHPLLNEETPLVSHGSDHGSDHSSHRSRGYKEIPNDSDEESETHDDVDDEEERDEMGGAKDDESKPEITWTEDDQKNLMDLGTLELERNQRLESLIARRRARKLMVEKNLIDLNYDLPFTVTPISTSRKNPFDLPYDSNENTGLPPIPGSAPSIMSQRRNPFDLPYDSSEEKPDLTTDSFQQEFSPLPSRETMFRRHESFNIGPSIFAPPRFDRDDFRFRPYFVPEGSSHSSFQRQTSELSDISKISSVLETETESICSIGEHDDKKIDEEDVLEDVEMDDQKIVEENVEMDDKKSVEEDVLEDVEMSSDLEDPSELVGHGSESSEDEDVAEVREFEESEVPSVSLTRALSSIDEVHYSSESSSSSLSEEHERAFDEEKHELSTNLELKIDKVNEQTDVTKEPVYDLSPSSVRKNLSCSSVSSDLLVEHISEMDKTVVSFSDRQIDFCNESSTSGVTDKAEKILDHELSKNDEKLDEREDDRVETSVRNDLVEEHLFSEDVVLQENEDQIHSSSLNAYSKWVSVEKPMDELHSFDKPGVNLSAENHEELLEPTVHLESIAEDHDEDGTLCSDHNLEQVTVQEPDFLEEGKDIQEIDEGLLMELDNVGDFSIGELRSSLNEMPPVEDIDSILLRTEPVPMKNEAEISSRMLVFEAEEVKADVDAPLIEEIEADCSRIGAETENKTVFEPIHYEEIDSEVHELEGTSLQDIDTACKQIIDDEKLPENIVAEVAEIGEETKNKTVSEINSGMHELEVSSIQDIDIAFRQINEKEIEKPVIVDSLDSESLPEKVDAEVAEIGEETANNTIFEPNLYDEIDSSMHELEATSVEDINTAFRQISEKEIGEPDMVKPLDAESSTEKVEAEVSEFGEETENKTVFEPILYDEIGSAMHELEASSVEDINTAFRQINEESGKPMMVEPLEAESLPEKIEAEVSNIETPEPQITEARSIEDKDMDIKQHNVLERYSSSFSDFFESHIVETEENTEFFEASFDDPSSQNDELENSAGLEPIQEEEINSGMDQLEAQSLKDLNSAFRQIKENFENPIIVESLEAVDIPEKSEAGVFEIGNDKSDTIEADDQEEEINSVKLEVDSKSAKDIDTSVSQIKEVENKAVFEQMHAEEIDTGMKEFEARSLEDLRSAFRQIDEEEVETSVIVASLETDFVPETSEVGFSELERPESPVIEARSIEDNGLAFQQVHNFEKFSKSLSGSDKPDIIKAEDQAEEINYEMLELDAQSVKDVDATASSIKADENSAVIEPSLAETADVEAKDLEARVLEGINFSSRPAKEQVLEKAVFAESSNVANLTPEKNKAGVSKIEIREMPVVEASSIEDIGLAFKQVHESEENSSPIPEIINPLVLETEDQEEDINSKMFELDVQSIENVDAESGLIKEVEKPAVFEPVPAETVEAETKIFEARSLEDINLTFRHIKNEEVESPISIAAPIFDLVPDKSEAEVSETEAESQTQETTRSVEDVDTNTSFDQINKLPNTSDFEPAHSEEITSGLKELEAQLLEDIEPAFRQFKVEETEKPMVIESLKAEAGLTQNDPNLEETSKARSFEYVFIDKPSIETEDSSESCSSSQVESETKPNSIEKTDKLENQLKSKTEKESVGTKSNDEEAETSIKEPTKAQHLSGDFSEVEWSVEISSVPKTSTCAKEIEPNIKVPSVPLEFDGFDSSFSDGKDMKKGKSCESKSDSSSSSSSSSSDSD